MASNPLPILDLRKAEAGLLTRSAAASEPEKSPWYSPHTGTLFQKVASLKHLQEASFYLKIYPSGVKVERSIGWNPAPPEAETRGRITGFSDEAARRLRESFMSLKVDGYRFWAVTLTTHQIYSPREWRQITKRFRQAVIRAKWAGLWRVELQRRKAPHLHVAFWLPVGVGLSQVAALWLKACREHNDAESIKHAVQGREIDQNESGWAVYMALHDGKSKAAQLGWEGKQWGIWNRELFTEREPAKFTLSAAQHSLFLRTLAKLERSSKQAQLHAKYRAELQQHAELLAACPALVVVAPRRPKPPRLNRGNLLRCIKGDQVERIAQAIVEGRIGLLGPERSERLRPHLLAS